MEDVRRPFGGHPSCENSNSVRTKSPINHVANFTICHFAKKAEGEVYPPKNSQGALDRFLDEEPDQTGLIS